jgi:hypothetical protein
MSGRAATEHSGNEEAESVVLLEGWWGRRYRLGGCLDLGSLSHAKHRVQLVGSVYEADVDGDGDGGAVADADDPSEQCNSSPSRALLPLLLLEPA